MAEEVVLYGVWESAFSRRVEMALKLKGVEYKYMEEDLNSKSPSLLKYNPIHKKIPVLLHNGKPIVESQVILEYIDETWQGYPILPKDPYERAIARFWAKFIDEKCLPTIFKACYGEEKEREKAAKENYEVLKFLEEELKEKRFFGGENIGMVDIVANIIAFWVGVIEESSGAKLLTRDKFPKLSSWSHEFVSNGVIKECLPPRDKLLANFRNRFGQTNSSK
ncbi:glutathione S-transferase U8-like [Corylus avellana]|uniref:glutathione S-transferase U8-like n=1 Tax=Corylus avellana TaxID=13451 RepID=UPI00286B8811|nr:glutathione S-transferase U8-like [Corylus avellana]